MYILETISETSSDTSSELGEQLDQDFVSVSSDTSENSGENTTEVQYSNEITILANYIREHFKKSNIYIFRSVKIDGIYCCCVLYRDQKLLNVESVRTIVRNEAGKTENYSLYFDYFNSEEEAVELMQRIVSSYKLYDGDFYAPETYGQLLAEERVIPYLEEQKCSQCNINTSGMTKCGHYICLRCRENNLFLDVKNCPVCNKHDILCIYHNDTNVINNYHYSDLVEAIQSDNMTHSPSEDDEEYAPAEQLIAKQLHEFIVNNPGFINAIVGFIRIFNKFVGNP
jgi:hypothetical protein